MTTVDQKILELQAEIAKKNPAYQFKPLAGNHDSDWLKNKANREKKAKERSAQKDLDASTFHKMQVEACQIMLSTPSIMWWIENVLVPKCIPPKDRVKLEVDPETRRKQIEAFAFDDLLDDILEKGSVNL